VLKKFTVLWGWSFDKTDGVCSYYIITNERGIRAIIAGKSKLWLGNFLLNIVLIVLFWFTKTGFIFSCGSGMLFDSFNLIIKLPGHHTSFLLVT
jgi:hypothetical protein